MEREAFNLNIEVKLFAGEMECGELREEAQNSEWEVPSDTK